MMYIHKPCGAVLTESRQEEYEDDNPFCTEFYRCVGCGVLMAHCVISDAIGWWMFWAEKADDGEWKVLAESEIVEAPC